MNKTFLFLVSAVLLIGFASATSLQEFMSSSDMTLTMTQDSTTDVFSINTAGLSFDNQNIPLPNGVTINGVSLSGLLNGINLRADLSNGATYPTFSNVQIQSDSVTSLILDNIFSYLGYSFTSSNINADNSILTNLASQNPSPVPAQGNSYFVKNGVTYTFGYSAGFGAVPSEYKNKIGEAITRGVNSMNVQNVIEQNLLPSVSLSSYLPTLNSLGYNVNEVEFTKAVLTNVNYDVSVDLTKVSFQDGTYQIPVTITPLVGDTTPITKTITLVLSGIVNKAGEHTTTDTYVPSDFGVKEVVSSITGLPINTLVNIQVSDVKPSEVNTLSHTQGLKYLVISVDNQPGSSGAQISFSIDKTGVDKNRVSLYVWEGTSWTRLATHYDGETATEYTYTATTPHFSTFMIGETTSSSSGNGWDATAGSVTIDNSTQSSANQITPLGNDVPTETPKNNNFFSTLTGAVTGLINSGAGVPAILFLMIVVAGTIVLVVVRRRGK